MSHSETSSVVRRPVKNNVFAKGKVTLISMLRGRGPTFGAWVFLTSVTKPRDEATVSDKD